MKKILTILMTAALMVTLAIPTFAATLPSSLPPLPSLASDYIDYIAFKNLDGTYGLLLLGKNGEEDILNSTLIRFHNVNSTNTYSLVTDVRKPAKSGLHYGHYIYNGNKDEWQSASFGTIPVGSANYQHDIDKLIVSTTDIFDFEGTTKVFPPTPSISQILTEEVPNLVVSPMMKTLSILVPFGVGLMALLLCLPILRKVFYLFQVK